MIVDGVEGREGGRNEKGLVASVLLGAHSDDALVRLDEGGGTGLARGLPLAGLPLDCTTREEKQRDPSSMVTHRGMTQYRNKHERERNPEN